MRLLITLLIITLIACSTGPTVSGTETTGGPDASIITISTETGTIRGETGAGTEVTCVSANYIPYHNSGFSTSLIVEASGYFTISDLTPGNYSIIASAGEKRAIIQQVIVPGLDSPTNEPVKEEFDTTISVTGTIRKYGGPRRNGLVYLSGTKLYGFTTDEGDFTIDNVPQDKEYDLVIIDKEPTDVKDASDTVSLTVESGVWNHFDIDL